MPDTPTTVPLIVPMHLDAICVGTDDAKDHKFAPAVYDFSRLKHNKATDPRDQIPFIDEQIQVELFSDSPSKNAGIYLHWALPSALTRGRATYKITKQVLLTLKNQGFPDAILNQFAKSKIKAGKGSKDPLSDFKSAIRPAIQNGLGPDASEAEISWYQAWVVKAASHMKFPGLPDRWIVMRIQTDSPSQPHKAWLIESDYVTSEDSYGSASIPWPFTHADMKSSDAPTEPYYRYLGRMRALNERWSSLPDEGRVSELTAIGYGQPSFTGYLPHCQNSFGHYDPLEHVDTSDGAVTLSFSYIVVGWFSDPRHDPLNGNLDQATIAQLLANLRWTLQGYDPEKKPEDNGVLQGLSGTYYSGIVQGVQWNPAHAYNQKTTLDADVVIGRTAAEALATYLAGDKTSSGPLSAEEKLEALQLGILGRIENSPDADVFLEQALHTSGFHAENGGSVWRIVRHSTVDTTKSSSQQFEKQMQAAPDEDLHKNPQIGAALNKLNTYQRLFDTLQFQNEEQRRRLFYLWYWYLKVSYGSDFNPDLSGGLQQALQQLTTRPPLDQDIAQTWRPIYQNAFDDAMKAIGFNNNYVEEQTSCGILELPIQNLPVMAGVLGELGQQIMSQATALAQELIAEAIHEIMKEGPDQPILFLAEQLSKRAYFELQLTPAPRFWQPNDPVLLILDKNGQLSARFDTNQNTTNTPLLCRRLDQTMATQPSNGGPIKLSLTDDLENQVTQNQINIFNNLLAEEFSKRASSPEKWGAPGQDNGDGVSLNNPWHPILMQWEANFYSYKGKGISDFADSFIKDNTTLDQNHIDLAYAKQPKKEDLEQSQYSGTVILSHRAVTTLQNQAKHYFGFQQVPDQELQGWVNSVQNIPILSQAIHGLNDALTGRLKEMQLMIHDPNAGEDDADLIQKVGSAIGRYNDSAPMELDEFNPIQAGFFELTQIRLIDVFGQYRDIENPDLIKPQRLNTHAKFEDLDLDLKRSALFPPRLVQPSRLLFRWLSADVDQAVEMNSHPATSPVCGWVVSNHLDDSLMIYDRDGNLLGEVTESYNRNPGWEPAPGGEPPFIPDDIQNAQLKNFVQGLLGSSMADFKEFREKIENVLLTIEPDSDPQQSALSVLMGRPLALVQAMLSLELKGLPACRLNESSFQDFANLDVPKLDDDGFPAVQFPVRLGDLSQRGDGLVGYFTGNTPSNITYNASSFQAEDQADNLLLALYDRVYVTMLVDPRASVHATCGILPVKAIDIPADQYAAALRKMAVTFAVHPVIIGSKLRLPLPAESDQTWTWLSKTDASQWNPPSPIGKIDDRARYPHGEKWQLVEGWLKLNPFSDDKKIDGE